MLIPAFDFRASARPGPPTDALSSKVSQRARGIPKLSPTYSAPLDQAFSEKERLSDVSSCYLVAGLSQ
jgi:hypothetical protein